jgi:hypothetical protein
VQKHGSAETSSAGATQCSWFDATTGARYYADSIWVNNGLAAGLLTCIRRKKHVAVAISFVIVSSLIVSSLIVMKYNSEHTGALMPDQSPSPIGIGKSFDGYKSVYGEDFEVSTYRPDIYPASYIFRKDGITLTVTPLPKVIAAIDVFFESVPADSVEVLLQQYSGIAGWKMRPLTDPAFETHFPLFSTTDGRNTFYECNGEIALVQRDVGFGKLVLWIHVRDYPSLLEQYQKEAKGAS